mmetsp:Transcript_47122/g.112165  ORF Transcript_47122/g.112165 Transcript_47122/m.112165 type:complete len:116 (+) Transcript_47122:1140-1487(+)
MFAPQALAPHHARNPGDQDTGRCQQNQAQTPCCCKQLTLKGLAERAALLFFGVAGASDAEEADRARLRLAGMLTFQFASAAINTAMQTMEVKALPARSGARFGPPLLLSVGTSSL